MIAGERDRFVDHRIGMEIFHALGLGYERKAHVTYLNDWSFAPKLGGTMSLRCPFPIFCPRTSTTVRGLEGFSTQSPSARSGTTTAMPTSKTWVRNGAVPSGGPW